MERREGIRREREGIRREREEDFYLLTNECVICLLLDERVWLGLDENGHARVELKERLSLIEGKQLLLEPF